MSTHQSTLRTALETSPAFAQAVGKAFEYVHGKQMSVMEMVEWLHKPLQRVTKYVLLLQVRFQTSQAKLARRGETRRDEEDNQQLVGYAERLGFASRPVSQDAVRFRQTSTRRLFAIPELPASCLKRDPR
jgi:hypothetical protein